MYFELLGFYKNNQRRLNFIDIMSNNITSTIQVTLQFLTNDMKFRIRNEEVVYYQPNPGFLTHSTQLTTYILQRYIVSTFNATVNNTTIQPAGYLSILPNLSLYQSTSQLSKSKIIVIIIKKIKHQSSGSSPNPNPEHECPESPIPQSGMGNGNIGNMAMATRKSTIWQQNRILEIRISLVNEDNLYGVCWIAE